MIADPIQTQERLRRWVPWSIAAFLCGFIIVLILFIWRDFPLDQTRRTQSIIKVLSSVVAELFIHDFEQDPGSLHVLTEGVGSYAPVQGVIVHSIALAPGYMDTKFYRHAMFDAAHQYNYIAFAQASHLALRGEDSPRIRYILKMAKDRYNGTPESLLLDNLPVLYAGDPKAKRLFMAVESAGLAEIQRRLPRETLLLSLTNSMPLLTEEPIEGNVSCNSEENKIDRLSH